MGRRPVPSPKDVWKVAYWREGQKTHLSVGERLSLIHSELSDAVSAYQNLESPSRIVEELADVVLNAYALSCELGVDIENAVWEKYHKNMNSSEPKFVKQEYK